MQKSIQKVQIVVGFDLDGVIIDHTANKLALAQRYSVQLLPEETHSEVLSGKFSRDEYHAYQDELYGDSPFALSAPLMDGAFEVLNEMKEQGVRFVLISRRGKPENAIALLSACGLWGNIFNEQNVFFVRTPEEKNTISLQEGVTHFFDDERKVLRVIPDVKNRFLFDVFRQFDDEKELERIHDWEMLRRIVLKDHKGT